MKTTTGTSIYINGTEQTLMKIKVNGTIENEIKIRTDAQGTYIDNFGTGYNTNWFLGEQCSSYFYGQTGTTSFKFKYPIKLNNGSITYFCKNNRYTNYFIFKFLYKNNVVYNSGNLSFTEAATNLSTGTIIFDELQIYMNISGINTGGYIYLRINTPMIHILEAYNNLYETEIDTTNLIKNEIINVCTPNADMYMVTNNTLNDIKIDSLLQPNKYYELVYNESQNKFIAEELRN